MSFLSTFFLFVFPTTPKGPWFIAYFQIWPKFARIFKFKNDSTKSRSLLSLNFNRMVSPLFVVLYLDLLWSFFVRKKGGFSKFVDSEESNLLSSCDLEMLPALPVILADSAMSTMRLSQTMLCQQHSKLISKLIRNFLTAVKMFFNVRVLDLISGKN